MKYIYAFLCLFLASAVAQADQWFCVSTFNAAIVKYDGKWVRGGKAEERKFIFRQVRESDIDNSTALWLFRYDVKWIGIEIGEDQPFIWCKNAELPDRQNISFRCDPLRPFFTFGFNRKTLRYTYSNTGYMDSYINVRSNEAGEKGELPQTDEEIANPIVEIGQCFPL